MVPVEVYHIGTKLGTSRLVIRNVGRHPQIGRNRSPSTSSSSAANSPSLGRLTPTRGVSEGTPAQTASVSEEPSRGFPLSKRSTRPAPSSSACSLPVSPSRATTARSSFMGSSSRHSPPPATPRPSPRSSTPSCTAQIAPQPFAALGRNNRYSSSQRRHARRTVRRRRITLHLDGCRSHNLASFDSLG